MFKSGYVFHSAHFASSSAVSDQKNINFQFSLFPLLLLSLLQQFVFLSKVFLPIHFYKQRQKSATRNLLSVIIGLYVMNQFNSRRFQGNIYFHQHQFSEEKLGQRKFITFHRKLKRQIRLIIIMRRFENTLIINLHPP